MAKRFAGILTALLALSVPAAGQEEVFAGHYYRNANGETLPYRLFAPKVVAGRKYPLVVFLHGNGDQGSDLGEGLWPWYAGHGPFSDPNVQGAHPCFVVRPRCLPEQQWSDVRFSVGPQPRKPMTQSMRLVLELVDRLVTDRPVDPKRLYLTGYSMGGYGTWWAAASNPKRFAAIAPISGGGDPADLAGLKDVPVYAAHATWDALVPVRGSRVMVDALRLAGGHPRYVEYRMYGHNASIARALEDPAYVRWLLDEAPPEPPRALKAAAGRDGRTVRLTWTPGRDAESGIAFHAVYRDGRLIAKAAEAAYVDTDLAETTKYTYAVAAVNGKYMASARCEPAAATTPADTAPPAVAAVITRGPPTALSVRFTEPVEKASAENVDNYDLVPDGKVTAARLDEGGRTVHLTCSPLTPGGQYGLGVRRVRDRAARPNAIGATAAEFRYDPGWLLRWTFDGLRDGRVIDAAGRLPPAEVRGGAALVEGRLGKALGLDGADDHVFSEDRLPLGHGSARGAFAPLTVAAWVRGAGPVFVTDDTWTPLCTGLRVEATPQRRLRVWYGFGGKDNDWNAKDSRRELTAGAWNHLAVVILPEKAKVKGGTVNAAVLYINGEAGGGAWAGERGGDIWGTASGLKAGLSLYDAETTGRARLFKGAIDELTVYDRALSAAEIRSLAAAK